MARFEEMVTIGRVVKPQGRKGEILVEPLSDRPERFPSLRAAFVRGEAGAPREVHVGSCWPHKGRFVLKLEGVDSIGAAEAYRGLEIRIVAEALEPLPAGSFYHHELTGLRAEDVSGRALGTVAQVWETGGGAPVLVVRGPEGEALVPMTDAFVHRVDVTAGRVVVSVPELVDADR